MNDSNTELNTSTVIRDTEFILSELLDMHIKMKNIFDLVQRIRKEAQEHE